MENTLLKPMSCPSCANVMGSGGTITSSTSIPSLQEYCINNDVSIIGTVYFIDIKINIDTDRKIIVPNGSTLIIYRSHLLGCNDMWRGIEVEDGGSLVIAENSMIEDAYNAVRVDFPTNTTTTSTVIDISYTLFNKNKTGISISNYANSSGFYPFYIRDCIFSCRKIPSVFTGFDIQLLKQPITPAHPLGAPYFDDAIYPAEVLKAPYTGKQSYKGIDIAFMGDTQTPLSAPVYSEWEIGDPFTTEAFNLFDLQQQGIFGYNANISSVNAVFQNAAFNVNTGKKMGIQVRGAESGFWRLRVEPDPDLITSHAFYDCETAIEGVDYFEMHIEGTLIQSTQNMNIPSNVGTNGIWITTYKFWDYSIHNNKMYNLANGITFIATYGLPSIPIGSTLYTQYSGYAKISENRIQPCPTSLSVPNSYVQNAIVFNNTLPAVIPPFYASSISLNVVNNVLQDVYRGIEMLNWREKPTQITHNYISLTADLINPSLWQFGINYSNNTGNFGLYDKFVIGNHIKGFGQAKANVWGIYCDTNDPFEVRCNYTFDTFRGIQFDQTLNGNTQRFWDNTMDTHAFGYILGNNGNIGPQITPPDVSDNQWINNIFMTLAENSDAMLSRLNVRPIPGYDPHGFGAAIGSGILPYSATIGSITYGNPAYPYRTCNPLPTPQMLALRLYNIGEMENIALGTAVYLGDALAAKSMQEMYLFQALSSDTTLLDSSAVLQTFFDAHTNSTIGKIHTICAALQTGDYTLAQSIHATVSPITAVEQAYYDLLGWQLKVQSTTLSSSDSLGLATLASACPHNKGMAVYTARAFHNAHYHVNHTFEGNCSDNAYLELVQNANRTPVVATKTTDYTLFPNPAHTEVSLQLPAEAKGNYTVTIWDATGKCLQTTALSSEVILHTFALPFASGLYFFHIQSDITHESQLLPLSIH